MSTIGTMGTLKSNVVACPDLHKSLHKISCAEKAGKGLIVPKLTEQRLGWFGPGLERGNGTGRISPKRPDWITAEAADPQEPLDTEKIARSRAGLAENSGQNSLRLRAVTRV